MPPGLQGFYYTNPLGLPMVLWVVVVVLLLWNLLRSTRYGPYLYATEGGISRRSSAGCRSRRCACRTVSRG